jgi:hypothetical protein
MTTDEGLSLESTKLVRRPIQPGSVLEGNDERRQ